MGDPSIDAAVLYSLFRELRKEYGLVPQQLARAQIILSEGRAAQASGTDLALLLTPILAGTAEQQRDLHARLSRIFASSPAQFSMGVETTSTQAQTVAHSIGPIGPGPPEGRDRDQERHSKRARWVWVGGLALALIAIAIAIYTFGGNQNADGPNNSTPRPKDPTSAAAPNMAYRMITTAIGAAPVILLAGWWLVRRKRLRTLQFDGHEEIGLDRLDLGARTFERRLFSGRDVAQSARGWRRYRQVPTVELDPERTIAATISMGGLFTPVMATRPLSPDYIMLLEETGRHDHVARLADNLVNRMVEEGVTIRRFYYEDGFHNLREDRAPPGLYVRLAQNVAATDRETLVIVGSGAELFDPLTERPNEKLLDDLRRWPRRVFLSTRPITAWSDREQGLVDAGFALATLGVRGVEAVGSHIARGFPTTATPLNGLRNILGEERQTETGSVWILVELLRAIQSRIEAEITSNTVSRTPNAMLVDLNHRIDRGDIAGLLRLLDRPSVHASGMQDLVVTLRQRLAAVSTRDLERLREVLTFQKSGLADLSASLRLRLSETLSQLELQNPGIRLDKIEQVVALLDQGMVAIAIREIDEDSGLRDGLDADHLLAEIRHRLAEMVEENPRKGAKTPPAMPISKSMAPPTLSWRAAVRPYFQREPNGAFLLGLSSGAPFAMITSTLTTRLAESGMDKKAVTAFALTFLLYNFKFLWAPLIDRIHIPVLAPAIGQRRAWLFTVAACTMAAIVFMGRVDPVGNIQLLAIAALTVAFFGATFDIIIDAFRIESLKAEQLGVGSGMSQYGWRLGSAGAGWLALVVAERAGWDMAYAAAALFAVPAVLAGLLLGEPARRVAVLAREIAEPFSSRVRSTFVAPLADFFTLPNAWLVLLFVIVHKIGDTLANLSLRLLLFDLGFSKDSIAAYDVGFGLGATLVGVFVGGIVYTRIGMMRSVMLSLVLMGVSNLGFAWLATMGTVNWALALTIGFENFTSGMGGIAIVAYLSWLCNLRFTATQFALLSTMATIVGRFIQGTTVGALIENVGFVQFYLLTTALALPGIFSFWWLTKVRAPEISGRSIFAAVDESPSEAVPPYIATDLRELIEIGPRTFWKSGRLARREDLVSGKYVIVSPNPYDGRDPIEGVIDSVRPWSDANGETVIVKVRSLRDPEIVREFDFAEDPFELLEPYPPT